VTAPIRALEVVDSTNAEAARLAAGGEFGPLWITAETQTAGRGRRGRPWSTARGNLAATYLAPLTRPPSEAAGVSFVAALAVADLADAYAPKDLVTLKWPNDVLLAGRKLSGVLVETGGVGDARWLALGVGVNLVCAPRDVERPAAALADHLKPGLSPPEPRQALDWLAVSLDRWMRLWDERGLGAIIAAWTNRVVGLPGPCVARLPAEVVEGHAEGIDPDGALRLRLAGGELRRITAGDVAFG
jgi:BirA family biotin operon repressor/biotin-[acetyl-CoA-carboxylase] ligase